MSLGKQFDASTAEKKWYAAWKEAGVFSSVPNEKPAYTIVIPPPNVTGVLHMGHMLNNTIQDVLVRTARMKGKNACWVPGTDHASIATESKVVEMLREKGMRKADIGRESFLEYAWEWKEKYGGIILSQLERLGASCDWSRTRFTMEPSLSDAVQEVFIRLYRDGLIYKGERMVNWDPRGITALSDEEVIFKETPGNLYYVQYPLSDGSGKMTVATTRPETILADTAICVHPEDERYVALVGKKVIVPLTGREVMIIADGYVEKDFGTGVLKITPAHDPNDHEIGKKHGLEVFEVIDALGRMNNAAGRFAGLSIEEARTAVVKDLEEQGFLLKVEPIVHQVGYSERSGAVVEPRISMQWFVDMKALMDKYPQILTAVMEDEIQFYPPKFKNNYAYWLENIKDWCISRQLWWGHRIPAWYGPDGRIFVGKTADEAWVLASAFYPGESHEILTQDEDVLDTWFSSWLWPFSVFDGLKEGENKDLSYYYPTADLVTGPDILFFWVARMVMAGYIFMGKAPFKNVYFTGIVRDKLGRKMSKSLGNSPDALALIDQFGADGVRAGLLMSASAGNDLLFDDGLCLQGRNFSNKIWNARRLLDSWSVSGNQPLSAVQALALEWYHARLQLSIRELNSLMEKFRIADAFWVIHKLWKDDFCSVYLELMKPDSDKEVALEAYESTLLFFDDTLRLLHPFMPFVTEELWNSLPLKTKESNFICTSLWPAEALFDNEIAESMLWVLDVVSAVRNYRQKFMVSNKELLPLYLCGESNAWPTFLEPVIQKLAFISGVSIREAADTNDYSFLVKSWEFQLPGIVDSDLHSIEEIKKELAYYKGFLASVESKLSNARFVQNAKQEIVENEKNKKADAEAKISALEARLNRLLY